jgi:hypothetical protein
VRLIMMIEWAQRETLRLRLAEFVDALRAQDRTHFEGVIELCWWCTWRRWLSGRIDALTDCMQVRLERHMESLIVRTWIPCSGMFVYTIWGRPQGNVEMHYKIMIKRGWRGTWRLWLWDLGGRARACLEIHLNAINERM